MRLLPLAILGALALGAGLPAARAQAPAAAPRVGLFRLEVTPEPVPDVLARYRQAIVAGFARSLLPLAAEADVDRARTTVGSGCATADCQRRLALAVPVEYLVTVRVQQSGQNYVIELEGFDPRGRLTLTERTPCDICTLGEAVARSRGAAADYALTLKAKHQALPPPPEPPRRKVAPPRRVEPPRREPPRREPPRRVEPPRPPPRPLPPAYRFRFPLKQAAWMTGVGGLLSVVAGATLLGLDHRPTCDLEPATTRCPYRLNTGAAGATLTALGAASLAASGVLFYLVYRRRPSREPRARVGLAPMPGGVLTHATLRF